MGFCPISSLSFTFIEIDKPEAFSSNDMPEIEVYIREWNLVRRQAAKTIEIIDQAKAWEYRVAPNEFSVSDTFYHTIRAIYEDAGNSFDEAPEKFQKTDSPIEDTNRSIDRIIRAIEHYTDEKLTESFVFPWCEETNFAGAIEQILFHTVGHLAQLRERVGVLIRTI
ncbi:MAG: hypothetical protein ACXAEF_02165 [Candidatus Thorarchaeota archaeon]|jgi:hypothetical protein